MKTSLTIFILGIGFSANAQINQKTIELRSSYTKASTYHLRETRVPESLQYSFLYKDESPTEKGNQLTEVLPQPSTQSIKKAFIYHNSIKKPVNLSGVHVVGYSLLNSQQFMISSTPKDTSQPSRSRTKD